VIISYPKKNELTSSAVNHVLLLIIIFYTEEGTVNLQDSAKDAASLKKILLGSIALENVSVTGDLLSMPNEPVQHEMNVLQITEQSFVIKLRQMLIA
jgi:hypothetical protein